MLSISLKHLHAVWLKGKCGTLNQHFPGKRTDEFTDAKAAGNSSLSCVVEG